MDHHLHLVLAAIFCYVCCDAMSRPTVSDARFLCYNQIDEMAAALAESRDAMTNPRRVNIRRIASFPDHAGGALALAWAANGVTLAAADARSVHLWDAEKGMKLSDLFGPTEDITSLTWSPDGLWLAASAGRTIWLWGPGGVRRIASPYGSIIAIDWSPDGRFLAWAGRGMEDPAVHLWDVAANQEVVTLAGVDAPLTAIGWSPDGQMIAATADDGIVRGWTGQSVDPLLRLRGHQDAAWSLSWSPDGRMLATGGLDGKISIWDIAARSELRELHGHANWVYAVAWSPDGRAVASASGDPDSNDRSLRIWDPLRGVEIGRVEPAHASLIHAVAWSFDSIHLATASQDERVSIWEVTG